MFVKWVWSWATFLQEVWSYYMCTCTEHCSSVSRQNHWMWYRDEIKIMMMMPCLYLLTGSSGITTCVLLQNIVVVYRDMFVTLYRKSGITTCEFLQNIIVVCRDIFAPFYRKSGKAEAQNQMGQSVTHASIQPTQSPSWEEILLVEFREENSKDEGWLSGKFYSFLCNTVHVPKVIDRLKNTRKLIKRSNSLRREYGKTG